MNLTTDIIIDDPELIKLLFDLAEVTVDKDWENDLDHPNRWRVELKFGLLQKCYRMDFEAYELEEYAGKTWGMYNPWDLLDDAKKLKEVAKSFAIFNWCQREDITDITF